ncbi:midasin [Aethina tumida]|uniref:midasin n=1 Tax=Aethina tumida TaxID=116153 RepID=UPI002148D057|nr:midasin [Aethina tumida]
MEIYRRSSWLLLLLGVSLLTTALQGVQGEVESEGPSESECRPYIEKALKELETGEAGSPESAGDTGDTGDSKEDLPTVEITTDDSDHQEGDGDDESHDDGNASTETESEAGQEAQEDQPDETQSDEKDEQEAKSEEAADDDKTDEVTEDDKSKEDEEKKSEEAEGSKEADSKEGDDDTKEEVEAEGAAEADKEESKEDGQSKEDEADTKEDDKDSKEEEKEESKEEEKAESKEDAVDSKEEAKDDSKEEGKEDSKEETKDDSKEEEAPSVEKAESKEEDDDKKESVEEQDETKEESAEQDADSKADDKEEESKDDSKQESAEDDTKEEVDAADDKSKEDEKSEEGDDDDSARQKREAPEEPSKEDDKADDDSKAEDDAKADDDSKAEDDDKASKEEEDKAAEGDDKDSKEDAEQSEEGDEAKSEEAPEEDLTLDIEIPENLRPREHVEQLLKLDRDSSDVEAVINRVSDITLRELKKLYENAIKPLEVLYKYRDLSNRHFGDSEIFSKPLILFMGPWSGGKSSIINYLVNNEYNETSLRTGAEPSPAYFNILMHGEEPEVVDGTELAADFTFSGLQKFGQGLEERLRGLKIPSKLLEKVNIVEIPGILEVRKQISRVFPFNDACQWFIDRADIIFLVYDPSKLDVGPETEAILDQLKGREHQTRIILNKADQVKPEELMRVQGALIWNISPLMSSPQPPIMYTTSLWSRPYESWAPVRLLQAQERAFLRDLRGAIDKRIENKIASARRFAVRVRNHAKMVDCYLTTYYNHKSVFGNRKQVADAIIQHPQDYHIYEGLSTLTNISRYDLPDPEVYKDFFNLNPLYDFQQLSATCTYFRGCPINRLDIAIAYDLPELVGTHRRNVEVALQEANLSAAPGS